MFGKYLRNVTGKSRGVVAFVCLVVTLFLQVGVNIESASANDGTQEVYRLRNRITHEHLYTGDARERDILSSRTWIYEGVGWLAPASSSIPVYRLYNPSSKDHHYTADLEEIQVLTARDGWQNEGIVWYSDEAQTVPVYRQFKPSLAVGSHNYTADSYEYDVNNASNGWNGEGVAWYGVGTGWAVDPPQEVYRLCNRITREHLYTGDARERDVLSSGVWIYEGVGWLAPASSSIPVYRLYNPSSKDHHYTADLEEIQVLTARDGWRNEGIAWYSNEAQTVPVYRQFKPGLAVGSHNYTADSYEYDVNNASHGWNGEGAAWYAVSAGWAVDPPIITTWGRATYDSRTGQYWMDIPWIGQQTNIWCGPAALEMVLRYKGYTTSVRGEPLSQTTLANSYYTNANHGKNYTNWEEARLSLAFNRWVGRTVYMNYSDPTPEEFRAAVIMSFIKDTPVMVDAVQVLGSYTFNNHGNWGTFSHCLVVTGYNDKTGMVTLLDSMPGRGGRQFSYNLEEFSTRFLQSGVLDGHGMVFSIS